MPRDEIVLVYIGLKGTVVALERASGVERWRTKLKGLSFVSLHRDDRYLYAGTSGELFCLDPGTGAVVWRNKLKGLGFGLVSMLSDAARASLMKRSTPRSSAIPSTGTTRIAESVLARTMNPEPVTPAAPFDVTISTASTLSCWPSVSSTPNAWAMKSVAMDR